MKGSLKYVHGVLLVLSVGWGAQAAQPSVVCVTGCDAAPVITFNGSTQAWDVTVSAIGEPQAVIAIKAVDGSTPIGNVVVKAGLDQEFEEDGGLVALTIIEDGGTIPFVRSVQRVAHPTALDGELRLTIIISGSLGPGTIRAERIVELRANGGSQATIQSGPPLFETDSTINVLRCDSGSITGSITVNRGDVEEEDAGGIADLFAGGDIGTSNSLVSISTSGTINSIEANSIYANINTLSFAGADGDLWSLRTNVGDFKGSLITRRIDDGNPNIESGLDIAGSLDADISITGAGAVGGPLFEPIVVGGSFPSNHTLYMNGELRDNQDLQGNDWDGRIIIGGQLAGTVKIVGSLLGDITVGSSGNPGLLGQVIVNSYNVPGGDWYVGNLRCTGPSGTPLSKGYNTLPSTMGGGAVGVVPFTMHGPACSPPNNYGVTVITGNPAPTVATIEHYGPVRLGNASNPGVTIEREHLVGPPGYSNAGISFSNAVSGSNPRALVITCTGADSFAPGWRYRIKPITGGSKNLFCDQLTIGGDVDVDQYEYIFEVIEAIGS